ncbi:expressed protein [Phakopsora pachyrhizi]|uniref:Expressed protein n=1 Tax=Phakopsora pachyrhizi TaxID=170000 RepID=A0AAV0AXE0_PHAPC|nr:expressed protein [Phakopsora pachyrhizi]
MLRHIERQIKRVGIKVRGLQEDSSDSDSSEDSLASSEGEEDESGGSESDKDPERRIPRSLLDVIDSPIINLFPKDIQSDEGIEVTEDDESDSGLSNRGPKGCTICPGKKLKTIKQIEEHLKSQAHKRRLFRYQNFIHNPPPHTFLSPDPGDVVELLDALIGPPPIFQPDSSSASKVKKTLKRQRGDKDRPETDLEKTAEKLASGAKKDHKLKRKRIRKGKRERELANQLDDKKKNRKSKDDGDNSSNKNQKTTKNEKEILSDQRNSSENPSISRNEEKSNVNKKRPVNEMKALEDKKSNSKHESNSENAKEKIGTCDFETQQKKNGKKNTTIGHRNLLENSSKPKHNRNLKKVSG